MQALGDAPASGQEKPECTTLGPVQGRSLPPPTADHPHGAGGGRDREQHSRVGPAGLDLHGGLAHPPVPGSQGETGEGAHPGGAGGGGWRGNFPSGGVPEALALSSSVSLSLSQLAHLQSCQMTLPGRMEQGRGGERSGGGPGLTQRSVSCFCPRAVPSHRGWGD